MICTTKNFSFDSIQSYNSCYKWLGVSVHLWPWSCCQVLLLAAQFWVKAGVLRTATGLLPPPTPPCCPGRHSLSHPSPSTPKHDYIFLLSFWRQMIDKTYNLVSIHIVTACMSVSGCLHVRQSLYRSAERGNPISFWYCPSLTVP